MDWSIPQIILQLIFLEGVLSIDNAAILGSMVAVLPDEKPVPWPNALKKVGDALHPLLGNERTAALRVGLLGAYVGRGAMLFAASLVSQNPWIKLIGAIYLVRLAFDNLGKAEHNEDEAHDHPVAKSGFWSVVLVVELTDLIFSLDNVVAAVALSDKLWVVITGVFIGILLMRFAAGWFSYLVDKEPILKKAAYILILNIGVELIISEITGMEINSWLRFGISIGTILLCLLYAHSKLLQKLNPVFNWLAEGFANINEMIDWILVPVLGLIKLIFSGIGHLFKGKKKHPDESSKSTASITD